MAELIIPHIDKFRPKGIGEVRERSPVSRGTFEFVYEKGERAKKLVAILSEPKNRYILGDAQTTQLRVGGEEYTVEKHDVFKDGRSAEKIGVLEIQKDSSGLIHAVFLGASNHEAPDIAALFRRC